MLSWGTPNAFSDTRRTPERLRKRSGGRLSLPLEHSSDPLGVSKTIVLLKENLHFLRGRAMPRFPIPEIDILVTHLASPPSAPTLSKTPFRYTPSLAPPHTPRQGRRISWPEATCADPGKKCGRQAHLSTEWSMFRETLCSQPSRVLRSANDPL